MQMKNWTPVALCLVAAFGLMVTSGPALGDQEVKLDKDVVVKVIKCDDGDCEEVTENLVGTENSEVLVDDKRVVIRKMQCEGDDCGNHEMVFVGDDGRVEVLAGGKGHSWVSHHGGLAAGGGFLGVGLTELTPELREHFGVPAGAGVMVSKVMDDSPAFRAGLQAGDIIAGVDGEAIADGAALGKTIRSRTDGEEVALDVWRDGSARTISAAIEVREPSALHAAHGDPHKRIRKIMIECDSDEEDCGSNMDVEGAGFDCGGSDECEVEVTCKDGGCTCRINGEDADCAGIPGVPGE